MTKLITIMSLVVLVSCSKEFVLQESAGLDNFTCPSNENCLSSKEKAKSNNYIMPFKMLAATGDENIELVEKVLAKIGDYKVNRVENYIKATSQKVQLEFLINQKKKVIEVRSQVIKHGFFSYDQGRKEIELVRFNLFQGNY